MKSAVDVMDIIGLHFTMTYSGKGQVRMLSAGLGWSAAHATFNYFVYLLVGAREAGFSWRYVQTALESNVYLVFLNLFKIIFFLILGLLYVFSNTCLGI